MDFGPQTAFTRQFLSHRFSLFSMAVAVRILVLVVNTLELQCRMGDVELLL